MNGITAGLLTTATACLLAGCQHVSPKTVPVAGPYRFTQAEQALMSAHLDGRERPRLGLAISGGGVRSSLYNFGVLKALYDDGVLDDVDLVSSVSGGSYLTYWLYSEQLKNPGQAFGAPVFAPENFNQRLCEFSARSNFVPVKKMAWTLALQSVNWNAGRSLYERRMRWTFGQADSATDPVRLQDLQPLMRDHGHPYLVMNATTFGRRFKAEPPSHRVFEMTPLHYGSLGDTMPWDDERTDQARLIQAALASGAAISPLKRRFYRPFQSFAPSEYAYLWDGGKSENLGAVASLRRGASAVVIIDAQFDGRGEAFSAYDNLQALMATLKDRVALDRGAEHVRNGVYPGTATGPELDAQLVYVKMERPARVMEAFVDFPGNRTAAANAEHDEWWKAYEAFDQARGAYANGEWACNKAAAGREPDVEDLMRFNLAAYLAWADGNTPYRRAIRKDYPLIGSAVTHAFPRTTTVDQSMYIDQSLAYIALGYLTASGQVRAMLEQQRPGLLAARE